MSVAIELAFVLAVPWVIGWTLLHLVFGRGTLTDEVLGKIPVGLALGLGLTGATTFASMWLIGHVSIVFELVLLAAVLVAARVASAEPMPAPRSAEPLPRWLIGVLAAATVAVVACAVVAWASRSMHEPHGAWDAWDFWNMRARWFARAGDDWSRAFSEIALWSHPSYPPLLSAALARGFVLTGSESVAIPMTHAAAFTLAPPLLLAWTLLRVRGPAQAWLGGLTLLAVPFFVSHGADQYADGPLGFFFALSFAAIAMHDGGDGERPRLLVLAGLAASLAALTKNEGGLFFVTLVLARSVVTLRRGGKARWLLEGRRFAIGALAVGALVLVFKLGYSAMPRQGEFYVGPSAYWNHGPLEHITIQLGTADRWVGLFESWWLHLTTFDEWWPVPLLYVLGAYGLICGLSPRRPRDALSTFLGLFAIEALFLSWMFLAWSTYEIREHMDAVGRLLYQLLPCVMLTVFLALRAPLEVDEDKS